MPEVAKEQKRRLVITGMAWNTTAQLFQAMVSLGSMLILVRIIPPSEYGRASAALGWLILLMCSTQIDLLAAAMSGFLLVGPVFDRVLNPASHSSNIQVIPRPPRPPGMRKLAPVSAVRRSSTFSLRGNSSRRIFRSPTPVRPRPSHLPRPFLLV